VGLSAQEKAKKAQEKSRKHHAPCRHSEACRIQGRCWLREQRCVALKGKDCRASLGCEEDDRCFLNRQEETCDEGQLHSTPMTVTGVVMLGVGGLAVVAGTTTLYLALLDATPMMGVSSSNADSKAIAGGIVTGVGEALIIAGVPLTVVGSRSVPRDSASSPNPTVSIGPTGGSLTWSF
jgi:hypothetical protein